MFIVIYSKIIDKIRTNTILIVILVEQNGNKA